MSASPRHGGPEPRCHGRGAAASPRRAPTKRPPEGVRHRAQKPRRASDSLTSFATIIDTNNTCRYNTSSAHMTPSGACTRPQHEHTRTSQARRQRLLSPKSAASRSLAHGPARPAPSASAPPCCRPSGCIPPRPWSLATCSIHAPYTPLHPTSLGSAPPSHTGTLPSRIREASKTKPQHREDLNRD